MELVHKINHIKKEKKRRKKKLVHNCTIPIILPSGKNILADTMFKISIGYSGIVSTIGVMGSWTDRSYWTHLVIFRCSQCFTTGITKAVVGAILSVGWCI